METVLGDSAVGDRTAIEWADASWNPIRSRHRVTGRVGWQCVRVSPGCEHCYAERLNKVRGTGQVYTVPALLNVELFLDELTLTQPLRWQRPRRIFVCSMTDLFMEQVPEEWITQIWNAMAKTRQHTFLVLTKRAERMYRYCAEYSGSDGQPTGWPLPNVWLGVSAEDQRRYDERRTWLEQTPAAVRFWSLEPLLGPIDMGLQPRPGYDVSIDGEAWPGGRLDRKPDWVIVGGESGGPPERALVERCEKTRYKEQSPEGGYHVPCWHCEGTGWRLKSDAVDWLRSIRDHCQAAGVSFFHKQNGGPTAKSGGRLLDGREWSEYPKGGDDGR